MAVVYKSGMVPPIPPHPLNDDALYILEDFFDDVFSRPYTQTNAALKQQLQYASDGLYDYYLSSIGTTPPLSPEAYEERYPAVIIRRGNYRFEIFSCVDLSSVSSTKGGFVICLYRNDNKEFTNKERLVFDNYPIKLSLKNKSGIEVLETECATLVIQNDHKSKAALIFGFDIGTGEVGVELGNGSFEDQTRIVKLAVKSPMIG